MATQYTSILKLALPVQGELSGTWGDVVNDNITSMVEEAIAGRAVINTWTTNSHTLTTANGTTSESRCAMLEFTDTGAALTGAGEVICPAQPKIYIAKNASGQAITVKTSAGTGIAVQNGETKFVFCDGTNVVEAVTSMTTLKVGTGVQVSTILDEDNMASDSATALATQQSIKAYVDSQVTAQDLDFAGDTGTGAVDLDSQSLTVAGTANEIETSASGQTLTVGLPSAIIVTTSVTTPTVQTTNLNANDGTAAVTIADATGQTTINDAVLTTADINAGTIDNTTIGGTTAAAGSFTTVNASGNITSQGQVITNTINEQTATSGVTVDGVLLKDGGATFTADAVFGDNDKAIFGAGSDLQIYHNASNSIIEDVGQGSLLIRSDGTAVALQVNSLNQVYATSTETQLRYAGSTKLATTSTGIDVTGTVTADGLTVDGVATLNRTNPILLLNETDTTDLNVGLNVSASTFNIGKYADAGNKVNDLLSIDVSTGDISFYEDTGTTPKFFWDASAEALGIGTSSPDAPLSFAAATGQKVQFYDGTQGYSIGVEASEFRFVTDASGVFTFKNGSTYSTAAEYMRIDSSGNVGINSSAPTTLGGGAKLTVNQAADGNIVFARGGSTRQVQLGTTSTTGYINADNTSGGLAFHMNGTERMTLDASGNLLVGDTSATFNDTAKTVIRPSSDNWTIKAGVNHAFNRTGSDGDILEFYRTASTKVGSIGVVSVDQFYFAAADGAGLKVDSDASSGCAPCNSSGADLDNSIDVGHASNRWNDIYATNALIQTSDRNEKQDIAELDEAERRVAVAAKGLIRKFRWKDAVAEKGDDARIHFGIIAQELQAAFEAEGLDAGKYAMFIHSTWTDEETGEERSRMGVRYSELLAFIIAAI